MDDDVSTLASTLFFNLSFVIFYFLLYPAFPEGLQPSLVWRSPSKCLKHGYPARNRAVTQVRQKH